MIILLIPQTCDRLDELRVHTGPVPVCPPPLELLSASRYRVVVLWVGLFPESTLPLARRCLPSQPA